MNDRQRIYVAAFIRALGTGMAGVLLGVYLARTGFDPAHMGIVIGAGLTGAAVAAFLATFFSHRTGTRAFLATISVIGAIGTAALTLLPDFRAVLAAAFVGMVNGMGRDRGAALVLEQVLLPATGTDAQRTRHFAWYNVLQDSGHALGALLAAVPALLHRWTGTDELVVLRGCFLLFAVLLLFSALIYLRLSAQIEPAPVRRPNVSPESRRILWKISSLFMMDSLGGGFLTAALLSYFFFQRFGVAEDAVGLLFFGSRVANAGSHLAAAWLAGRIGLVNTMVFTHIPSSLLLVTVAFAPSFAVAAILFLLREGLVEMDVPTRQSYVMAMVKPEERTVASGVTHLVRMGGWAVAPSFAGICMQGLSLGAPLIAGAGLKIGYDLLLYSAFRRLKPPEERTISN